jgi:hypothetical protein
LSILTIAFPIWIPGNYGLSVLTGSRRARPEKKTPGVEAPGFGIRDV